MNIIAVISYKREWALFLCNLNNCTILINNIKKHLNGRNIKGWNLKTILINKRLFKIAIIIGKEKD